MSNAKWKSDKGKLFLVLLLFICLSILTIYYTHIVNKEIIIGDDISFHKNRIEGLYDAISNGVWFPRLNMLMMNSMGYASSIFYSDFFLYIPALFRLIGFSVSEAYIIFMIIINFLTFIISFFSFHSVNKKLVSSFLFSILFTTAPYRLLDLTTRAALGELLALTFLPLAFAGLYHIIYGNSSKWWLLTLGMTFIIYSHILSAVMFALLIAIFLILNIKLLIRKKDKVLALVYAVLTTVTLTLIYFIPVLEQIISQEFKVGSTPIFYMSEKAIDFGNMVVNSLSNKVTPNLGILLIIFLFIYGAYNNKLREKKTKDIYFVAVLMLIMTTTLFPWKLFDSTFLNTIQFPWRFLGFVTLLVCWIVAEDSFDWLNNNKRKMFTICFLSLGLLISYTVNIRTHALSEEIKSYEEFNHLDFAYLGAGKEYLPQSSNYDVLKKQLIKPIYDSNKLNISDYVKKRDHVSFVVNSKNQQKITLPLIYYKGYTSEIVGEGDVSEPFLDEKENGQLSILVNGTGKVTIQYRETHLQQTSLIISILGWILFICYLTYNYLKQKTNAKKEKE